MEASIENEKMKSKETIFEEFKSQMENCELSEAELEIICEGLNKMDKEVKVSCDNKLFLPKNGNFYESYFQSLYITIIINDIKN